MIKLGKIGGRLYLLFLLALLLVVFQPAARTHGQETWPPFWFDLIPRYENGQLIYDMAVYSRVEWAMSDLTIKVPLPAGTRFVEAGSQSGVVVDFDGQVVTFFTSALNRYTEQNWFKLQIIDPSVSVFSTQAYIAWKGERQGDFLAEPVVFDITRQSLNWNPPGRSRLQLSLAADVAGDSITYRIYPKAVDRQRMWDVRIQVPLPEGTTLLSVEAPAPFAAAASGSEVSFTTLELERLVDIGPLALTISTTGVTGPVLTTPVWVFWKNGPEPSTLSNQPPQSWNEEDVEPLIPGEEQTMVEMTIYQPRRTQQVVFDGRGDVPFPNYDLTGVALSEDGFSIRISFNTVENISANGQPLQFRLLLDVDCTIQDSGQMDETDADYRINYDQTRGGAFLTHWDVAQQDWAWDDELMVDSRVEGKTVSMELPLYMLNGSRRFCWTGQAANQTEAFYPDPPSDRIPDATFTPLVYYEITGAVQDIAGKLAIPLVNDRGLYDLFILSIPEGRELASISDARQPDFSPDGQRLLFSRDKLGTGEDRYQYTTLDGRQVTYVLKSSGSITSGIFEYSLAAGTETQLSGGFDDGYPGYEPQGNRLVYGTAGTAPAENSPAPGLILVQCRLLPQQTAAAGCDSSLTRSQEIGPVEGYYPLWADNGKLIYFGCVDRDQVATCGV